jgi:thiosulfate/3-mercaptopyruvate sulfurtransferase
LREHLGDTSWIIVDCRHELANPEAGRRAYDAGHIPGARHAHLDRDLSRPPNATEGRHPLPDPQTFASILGAWGISGDAVVVAYDESSGAMAARLWWMLRWLGLARAFVLDGGLAAWSARGFPLTTDPPSMVPATYEIREVRDDWVVSTADVPRVLDAGNILLDARSEARFAGLEEPIDPVAGHVPGAKNLPFSALLEADGRFLSTEALRERFSAVLAGREGDDVVAMCGSGVTACHLLLGLNAAGLGDGRLYAGSWSEWIRSNDRPIATAARR